MNIFITAALPKEMQFLTEIPTVNTQRETQEISHGGARWFHFNEGVKPKGDLIPVSIVVEIVSHLEREHISGRTEYYMHFQSLTDSFYKPHI